MKYIAIADTDKNELFIHKLESLKYLSFDVDAGRFPKRKILRIVFEDGQYFLEQEDFDYQKFMKFFYEDHGIFNIYIEKEEKNEFKIVNE